MKVLIVEDERSMALEMEDFLKRSSYLCDLAFTARQARDQMEQNGYDFILLDLGLPDKDGLLVLEEAKRVCPDASYIILTARGKLEDRIKGLDLGADDYLSKPFSLLELQSRMQAISRRKSGLKDSNVELGDFSISLGDTHRPVSEDRMWDCRRRDSTCYVICCCTRTGRLQDCSWENISGAALQMMITIQIISMCI